MRIIGIYDMGGWPSGNRLEVKNILIFLFGTREINHLGWQHNCLIWIHQQRTVSFSLTIKNGWKTSNNTEKCRYLSIVNRAHGWWVWGMT